eukprot:3839426-Ditylum_brightwellii.AAC.1
MRIARDFAREAHLLVVTKKPMIPFKVEESTDQKMGERHTYKLYMQPADDNSPMYSLTIDVFKLGF